MAIEAAGLTDVGLARRHNEDSLFVDVDLGLFIVADGLGGHAAGEVASKIVVDQVAKFIKQTANFEITVPVDLRNNLSLNGNRLKAAIQMSDRAITENIVIHPERDTMGSTVVACLIEGKRVAMAHVGDSRAYLLNKNGIRQLTKDHSWIAEQVENGILTQEEARRHPFRNVITQALGNGNELEVDVQEFEMTDFDAIMLCSDGLSGMVTDYQILTIFNQATNLENAVSTLVSKAIENGGEDNISVIIVKYNST